MLNWSRALGVWQRFPLRGAGQLKALAVGEREGGLSLWLASSGCRVHCTDLHGPSQEARTLHAKHGIQAPVVYEAQDIIALSYPDGTFDVVVLEERDRCPFYQGATTAGAFRAAPRAEAGRFALRGEPGPGRIAGCASVSSAGTATGATFVGLGIRTF